MQTTESEHKRTPHQLARPHIFWRRRKIKRDLEFSSGNVYVSCVYRGNIVVLAKSKEPSVELTNSWSILIIHGYFHSVLLPQFFFFQNLFAISGEQYFGANQLLNLQMTTLGKFLQPTTGAQNLMFIHSQTADDRTNKTGALNTPELSNLMITC